MSAHQLHRMLGVTYKTAWFMFHRIREAMSDPGFSAKLSGIVEVDETYVGGKRKGRVGRPGKGDPQKVPVVALVERGGRVRSSHVTTVGARELKGAIRENVDRKARIMTDQFQSYKGLDKEFASHEVVNHAAKLLNGHTVESLTVDTGATEVRPDRAKRVLSTFLHGKRCPGSSGVLAEASSKRCVLEPSDHPAPELGGAVGDLGVGVHERQEQGETTPACITGGQHALVFAASLEKELPYCVTLVLSMRQPTQANLFS